MPYRIIVITPDVELSEALSATLADTESVGGTTIVNRYVTIGQLKSLVEENDQPVTAFIVGLSDPDRGFHLIRQIRSAYPDSLTAAADMKSTAAPILGAMRAGASEFLIPPFDTAQLGNTLRRHAKAMSASQAPAGKLICVLPAQGGNGASTFAIHLAVTIAGATSKKVLLVDFDFHCGTIAFRLRLEPQFNFTDAAGLHDDLDEMWPRIVCPWEQGQVDVLTAPSRSLDIRDETFHRVEDIFASAVRVYPHVIVDFPPRVHDSYREILELTESVCLVATPEVVSLHLARRKVNELVSLGLERENIRLILNRVGSKKTLHVEDVAEVVGTPIYATLPNDYGTVADASLKGGVAPGDTRYGKQVRALSKKVAGVEPENDPSERSRWKALLPFQ